MANLVLPRVQAIVVCDGVKESDQEIDVFQLTGVRTYLKLRSFPVTHPRLCVFIQMTGHQGDVACHVEVNRVAADEVIYHTPARMISFDDPTEIVTVVFRVRNCVFTMPGLYYVQVFQESKLIGERALIVRREE